jgi:hypothetical protein
MTSLGSSGQIHFYVFKTISVKCSFQHDGATAYAVNTSAFLKEFFGDRIIWRGLWPPQSPDIQPEFILVWFPKREPIRIAHQVWENKNTQMNRLLPVLTHKHFAVVHETHEIQLGWRLASRRWITPSMSAVKLLCKFLQGNNMKWQIDYLSYSCVSLHVLW